MLTVDFEKLENQKCDSDLMVGNEVRSYITSHNKEEVTVKEDLSLLSGTDIKQFYLSVRNFYVTAVTYLLKLLPLKSDGDGKL